MTTGTQAAFSFAAPSASAAKPLASPSPDPATGPAALAVAVALLRALQDRGILSKGEIEDILADAQWSLGSRAAQRLVNTVRLDLERGEAE